jgi:GNAT superfamily N-acetyltransferase
MAAPATPLFLDLSRASGGAPGGARTLASAVYGRLRADVRDRARRLYRAQLAAEGEVIFLAERGGETVGILRCIDAVGSVLLEPPRYGYISSVYVRPGARRSGVLHALLRAAEDWCERRGLAELRLHNAADNPDAGETWQKLGFDVVEVLRMRTLHPRPPGSAAD